MTRKDYVLLARVLWLDAAHLHRETRTRYEDMLDWEKGAYDQWNTTVLAFSHALANGNPRFDRERFLKACGVAS